MPIGSVMTFFCVPESRDENNNLVSEKNQLNLQLTALAEEKEKLVNGKSYFLIIWLKSDGLDKYFSCHVPHLILFVNCAARKAVKWHFLAVHNGSLETIFTGSVVA